MTGLPRIIFLLTPIMLVSSSFFYVGGNAWQVASDLGQNGVRTEARVESMTVRGDSPPQHLLIVSFQTESPQRQVVEIDSERYQELKEGDLVSITFDPDDPHRVLAGEPPTPWEAGGIPIVVGSLAVFFLGGGIVLLERKR